MRFFKSILLIGFVISLATSCKKEFEGDALQFGFRRRQAVRLLVMHHLDTMFDGAEIPIGFGELRPPAAAVHQQQVEAFLQSAVPRTGILPAILQATGLDRKSVV